MVYSKHDQDHVPKKLADDLTGLFGTAPAVPEQVDEAILAMATERLSQGRRRWRIIRWLGPVAAAAAAILFVVAIGDRFWSDTRPSVSAAVVREDINGNGRVDIVDALVLAKHLESAGPRAKQWDINGDGTIDRADVDRLAMVAVRLDKGAW